MNPEQVHKLAGALILTVTLLLGARELGFVRGTWTRSLLSGGVFALGLFLVLDPIVFHGGSFGAEGWQHQVQGALAIAIAVIEALRERGTLTARPFALVLPAGIVAVGLLFVLHSQHGGGNMAMQLVQHRILGATVILAGVVKAVDNLKLAKGNWAAIGWLLLLVVASADLFLYVEGGGEAAASGTERPQGHGGHGGH